MKKALKILALVFALGMGGLLILVNFPSLLSPAVEAAARYAMKSFDVGGEISTQVNRISWHEVELDARLDGGRFRNSTVTLDSPVLKARFLWDWLRPSSYRWTWVEGQIEQLDVRIPSAQGEEEGETSPPRFPEGGTLSVSQFSVTREELKATGKAHLTIETPQRVRLGLTATANETGELALTYLGSPTQLKGTLSARGRWEQNTFQVGSENGLWVVQAQGEWGKATLQGESLKAFSGQVVWREWELQLDRCGYETALQCEVRAPRLDLTLGLHLSQDDQWHLEVTPVSLPPWIVQSGDKIRISFGTDPFQLSLPPWQPALVLDLDGMKKMAPQLAQLIPRPFNALGGQLSLSSDSGVRNQNGKWDGNARIRADLSSPDQRLLGDLSVEWEASSLRLVFVPEEVQLVAPPVRVIRNARFAPESRLQGAIQEKQPDLKLLWEVQAESGYPLAVKLPERGETLRFQGKLSGGPQGMEGWLAIKPTEISLLGKPMKVRYFKVSPLETGEWKINAGFYTEIRGYRVNIDLGGTSTETQISMESTPPLTTQELTGLILFGKLSPMMSAEEKSTAEGFQAAAVDGALNLLSLYFLSRTPIRGLSYNPVLGRVGISLEVGDGSSVTLETQSGAKNSLEWQKSLGGNWWFSTRLYSEGGVEPSQGQTFLEWIKRY